MGVAEQRLREDLPEVSRQMFYVLFVDKVAGGFKTLQVWDESEVVGVLAVTWVPTTSRGPRAAGPGRV